MDNDGDEARLDTTYIKPGGGLRSRREGKSCTASTIVDTRSDGIAVTETAIDYDIVFDEIIKNAKIKSNQMHQQRSSSRAVIHNDAQIITALIDLARSLRVDLPVFILKQVITLISHGVQPDDIFLFLKDAIRNTKTLDKHNNNDAGANKTTQL